MKTWYIYIVRCAKGALYTGITTDLKKRIQVHNAGKGAKAVKALGLPVRLVYSEEQPDKSSAIKREIAVKKLPKKAKENLVLYDRKLD